MADQESVRRAVKDACSLDGMRKSFRTIEERQRHNAHRIPDLEAREERLRKTKESSVGNQELLTRALATLKENGFRVILAKSPESALKVIIDEVGPQKLVVKSKSNVTKELHLADRLQEKGIEVIETDLGDRIVQLAGCAAAHPTGPACHLTRKEISGLFTSHYGRKVSDDPMELTATMKEEIASYLDRARVGITGANAITADEGAVVIVHNEGNAARVAMVPEKHIIVTTPEKIVPSLDDAVNVTKLQTYLSTGKIISSYINIITGPSYTADIEKQVYTGMHGPKEIVIVLVDAGRLDAEDKEAQYCIGCGMCLLRCPVYNIIGPLFGSAGHMGGQGVYLSGSTGKTDEAFDSGLYLCTSCGACEEVCPAKIDTKTGLTNIRAASRSSKKAGISEHESVIASVKNYENPWLVPRARKSKWAKDLDLPETGDVLYFAGCSTSLIFPETARKAVRVMRSLGIAPAYLGKEERCCGSTVRKLGVTKLARQKAEECFRDFKKAGARLVITSCPGCSSALNHFEDIRDKYGIEVQHISQFLDKRLTKGSLSPKKKSDLVTYHDPCDLGREQSVYDEPRRVIALVTGEPPLEMELCKEQSACCGSGAGVRSAYPELANAIATARVEMAKKAGARVIVTACPWCVQSLRECQGDHSQVRVVDLVELVDENLVND